MKIRNQKRKSFTLIEILIATTIFAFAIVACFGILMLVLGNQSSINLNSEVNRETQRIARQISDDVTAATAITNDDGSLKTKVNGVAAKGIAFAKYYGSESESGLRYEFVGTTADSPDFCYFNYSSNPCPYQNLLILFTKNSSGEEVTKIYRYYDNNITYLAATDANDVNTTFLADNESKFIKLNSDNVDVIRFDLGGFACMAESCKQSPYVQLDMRIESAKEIVWTGTTAYAEIRTMIAGRSL